MSGVFEAFRKEIEGEIGAQYLARGISIGEERGISIGEERGEERGIAIGRRAFARRLLADGFSCEKIADYTSLSLDEVRALASSEEAKG